jgi:predicted PurR-regulated permease PerM
MESYLEVILFTLVYIVSIAVMVGVFMEKVKTIKRESDQRFQYLTKEIETLKNYREANRELLNDIKVSLELLTVEISFIKKHIEKLENYIEKE